MKRFLSIVLAASLCPIALNAQDAGPGGFFYTFEIDQFLEADSDRDLATPEREEGGEAITDLRFGAVTETRSQRVGFDLGSGFRVSDGELTGEDINLRLAYTRNSADAVLDTSFSIVRSNIEFLRDASDFIDADGELVLPEDFEDLIGSGIRTSAALATSLRWGETDPLGYRVSLRQDSLRYIDASEALLDRDSRTLGAGLRLNINAVTTGNIDLSYSQTEEVGEPDEDRVTFSSALTFVRPLGDLTYRLSTTRNEDDDIFWAGTISRRLARPRSNWAGSISLIEDEDGDPRFTGSLNFTYPRPVGQIDLSAEHSLAAGGDRATTTLLANYAQELSTVSNMQFTVSFAEASDSDGSDSLATGALSGSYGLELSPLWQLSLGARVNVRDEDGSRRRSNTVFLGLQRSVSWRP